MIINDLIMIVVFTLIVIVNNATNESKLQDLKDFLREYKSLLYDSENFKRAVVVAVKSYEEKQQNEADLARAMELLAEEKAKEIKNGKS